MRQGVPYATHRGTAFAAQVLRPERPISLDEARAQAQRLRRDPEVEWAIPNEIEPAASIGASGDPGMALQTWLQSRDVGLRGVADIPKAWEALSGMKLTPPVVAVLDSGVLPHPDLAGRYWPGYDFVSVVEYARDGDGSDADPTDPGDWLTSQERNANMPVYGDCDAHNSDWHGLAIAGMLGANTGNGLYGGGILAPLDGPVILPVRVAGSCGAEVSDIIEGMLWAAGIAYQGTPPLNPHPARIINLSFGGDGGCEDTGIRDVGWLYRQTVAALKARGTLLIASAGNGDDQGGKAVPTRPASCPGVLAVTALHEQGFKASYANLVDATRYQGLAVDGGDVPQTPWEITGIYTTSNGSTQAPDPAQYKMSLMAGTSFAAPTVAGVAALMLAVDPHLSVDELVNGLVSTALPHISAADATTLGMPDLPTCAAGVSMQRCYCTTTTCGAGRLDADGAIHYALAQLATHPTGTTSWLTGGSVDYFSPSRMQTSSVAPQPGTGSSGGGGALDGASLAMMVLLMCWTLIGGGRR
ncbi:MAG TPA: S8 family serine peptidase, partial [Aquabacterium sp.]|nr:S8 family serine peptidase [Aquabacterium sp.]